MAARVSWLYVAQRPPRSMVRPIEPVAAAPGLRRSLAEPRRQIGRACTYAGPGRRAAQSSRPPAARRPSEQARETCCPPPKRCSSGAGLAASYQGLSRQEHSNARRRRAATGAGLPSGGLAVDRGEPSRCRRPRAPSAPAEPSNGDPNWLVPSGRLQRAGRRDSATLTRACAPTSSPAARTESPVRFARLTLTAVSPLWTRVFRIRTVKSKPNANLVCSPFAPQMYRLSMRAPES